MEANNQEQDQDLDVVKVTPEESIDENTEIFKKENGMESVEQNNQQELMLFRHHFFAQPGLLLRHHQEQQIKIQQQQQQLLSQWFQKEDNDDVILLKDGICQWPGCEKNQFASKATFQHHLNSEHALSQCSAAQAKVQLQIVAQLEHSLLRERERLNAMMAHLNKAPKATCEDSEKNANSSGQDGLPQIALDIGKNNEIIKSPAFDSSSKVLDTETEIMRNREFYRLNDIRPPYTYASLIRQAIVESSHRQLTLNEIYTWFQDNFAYFRRNAATWKNAIRTNLSLHKCFVRYEDDFGSFWTVDDREFLKRRHLSRGRPRKYDPTTGKFESLQAANSPPPPSSRSPVPPTNSSLIDFTRLIASNNAFCNTPTN